MSHTQILQGLNDKQHEAVTAPMQHILMLAGAGSGKTRVLVSRLAWLVAEKGVLAHNILAVTFTNKAAGEMKERLRHLLNQSVENLWVGTFHGLCHRLLRYHHEQAHLPSQFNILDSDDQLRVIKRIVQNLNLDPEQWPPKQAQAFINRQKDEGLRAQHVHVATYGPDKTWLKVYQEYQDICQRNGAIDFAELLLRAHELLRDNPSLLAHYQQRFRVLLVDEFQDTNTLQYAWIRLLAGQQATVMAVGDDDQSIYGWRGAQIENIRRFSRDFVPTTIIRLEQNYRSSPIILKAANALIEHNVDRMGKVLWTDRLDGEKITLFGALNEIDEAYFVREQIQALLAKGRQADDIAVLYRSNAQSRPLEDALIRAGVSYRIYGGVRFFERMEIKDTLAYLRLLVNVHDDLAFERIVNVPARAIGDKTLEVVRTSARSAHCSLWDAAKQVIDANQLPARASKALGLFIHLMEQLNHDLAHEALEEQVSSVLERSGLYTYFAHMKGDKSESKLDNLRELVNAAKQFSDEHIVDETPILVDFLAHVTLDSGELLVEEGDRCVHLMTIHASKGLEFPCVFLVGMEEGVFPGKQALMLPKATEEERRLCYVGMTRAKEILIMSYAHVRRQYGREERHRPSRFLQEIPQELVQDNQRVRHAWVEKTSRGVETAQDTSPGLRVGVQVRHPSFGSGMILAKEGHGAQLRVQVRFSDASTKWLSVAYAHLEVELNEERC